MGVDNSYGGARNVCSGNVAVVRRGRRPRAPRTLDKLDICLLQACLLQAANAEELSKVIKRLKGEGRPERTIFARLSGLCKRGLVDGPRNLRAITPGGINALDEAERLQGDIASRGLVRSHHWWFKARILKRPSNDELIKGGWRPVKMRNWVQLQLELLDCFFRVSKDTIEVRVPAFWGPSVAENEIEALKKAQEVIDRLGAEWRTTDLRAVKPPHHALEPLKVVAEALHKRLGTRSLANLIVDNSHGVGPEFECANGNAERFFGEVANIVETHAAFKARLSRLERNQAFAIFNLDARHNIRQQAGEGPLALKYCASSLRCHNRTVARAVGSGCLEQKLESEGSGPQDPENRSDRSGS